MIKNILLFITFSSFISCNGNKTENSESKAVYDQVMAIHDEVMPKMREIRVLSKQLKKVEKHEENEEITKALNDLKDADDAMMDWMAQFKIPKNTSPVDEMSFLNGQLVSVNAMKNKLLEAISNAEILVTKYKSS